MRGRSSKLLLENSQEEKFLHNSLKTLEPQDRLIVALYYIDHKKYFEIAEMLSFDLNTIATKLKRVKEKLRKQLNCIKNDR